MRWGGSWGEKWVEKKGGGCVDSTPPPPLSTLRACLKDMLLFVFNIVLFLLSYCFQCCIVVNVVLLLMLYCC